jgi:hypothetical protein
MGQNNTKQDHDGVGTTAGAALPTPTHPTDYEATVKQFEVLCTTCEEKWVLGKIDAILEKSIQIKSEQVLDNWKPLDDFIMRSGPKTDDRLRLLVQNERIISQISTRNVLRSTMRRAFLEIICAHALDIFKMMVAEMRLKDAWKKYTTDATILGVYLKENVENLLEIVRHSRENFEKYVRLVVDERKFLDPISGAVKPTDIKNAKDWAVAIRTLAQVVKLMDSHFLPQYEALAKRVPPPPAR